MDGASGNPDLLLRDEQRDCAQRGWGHDQAAPEIRSDAGSGDGCGNAGRGAGGRHAYGGGEHGRRDDRIYGNGHGAAGRRRRDTRTVWDGKAAAESADAGRRLCGTVVAG